MGWNPEPDTDPESTQVTGGKVFPIPPTVC